MLLFNVKISARGLWDIALELRWMCSEASAGACVELELLTGFRGLFASSRLFILQAKKNTNVSEYLLLLLSGVLCSPRTDRGESESLKFVWPVSFANHSAPSNDDVQMLLLTALHKANSATANQGSQRPYLCCPKAKSNIFVHPLCK